MSDRRHRLRAARLYLVCEAQPRAFLERALRGGVDIVQLRMKGAGEKEILGAGEVYARLCAEHGALFVLNDRPDLAAELGADGVHVGQDDASVESARALVGPDRLVGLSTHTPAQVDAATGVDYIGVGPVHATPTKPGRPAVGLALVRHAAAHATVPFFAIGGIDAAGAAEVRAAGGRRIAVVRALTEAEDPASAARALRAAIEADTTRTEAGVGAA
ncbi:MAG TPA: thiamine phosphate synthase [Solirubrobacteraceae bacterium]|nr:thiamine phosphate synthase [Solirubrobacteraceae bacterium]